MEVGFDLMKLMGDNVMEETETAGSSSLRISLGGKKVDEARHLLHTGVAVPLHELRETVELSDVDERRHVALCALCSSNKCLAGFSPRQAFCPVKPGKTALANQKAAG